MKRIKKTTAVGAGLAGLGVGGVLVWLLVRSVADTGTTWTPPGRPERDEYHVVKTVSVESSARGERELDEQTLAELAATSDASRPTKIIHYLLFATQAAAARAGREVPAPFVADVRGPSEGEWALVVTHTAIPEIETIVTARERLSRVAERHGGTYEGWEALHQPR